MDKDFDEFEFNDEAKQNFEPRGKVDILSELTEALDISLDEFHGGENVPQDFHDLRLVLGNQITIMETLKFLVEEKTDEPDKATT